MSHMDIDNHIHIWIGWG